MWDLTLTVKEAYGLAFRAMWIGLAVVTVNAFLIFIFGRQLLGLFTDNKEIIAMGVSLLGLNLLLQPGKMVNMALGNSLNAVGDTRFTMWTSVFSMWLLATGLAYWVGIELGWGLIGIYACMILDEYVRGTLSLIRWRGKKFLRKAELDEADGMTAAEGEAGGRISKQTALDV